MDAAPRALRLPATIHARAGEPIAIPYMGAAAAPSPAQFALLERRGGTYVQDWLKDVAIKDGFVTIAELPMGTFELWLKEFDQTIMLQVTEGEVGSGYVMGVNRLLELKNPAPLQIGSIQAEGDQVTIVLRHATPLTRVHVAAARFLPAYSLFDALNVQAPAEPRAIRPGHPESLYVSGRELGDEYRYILERKYAQKFPGNLLSRPSLLLNPWAVRDTETETEMLQYGGQYANRSAGGRAEDMKKAYRERAMAGGKQPTTGDFLADLDFLAEPSVVLANLKPDANGVVAIPRKTLGAGQQIRVVAVNANNVVLRDLVAARGAAGDAGPAPGATRSILPGISPSRSRSRWSRPDRTS